CAAAEAAVQALMEKVVALGGAISGEHGIGLAKTPFLRIQHSDAQVRAMKAVKDALDPKGILNPGKMFEVFDVWKHPRVVASFPWDHKGAPLTPPAKIAAAPRCVRRSVGGPPASGRVCAGSRRASGPPRRRVETPACARTAPAAGG